MYFFRSISCAHLLSKKIYPVGLKLIRDEKLDKKKLKTASEKNETKTKFVLSMRPSKEIGPRPMRVTLPCARPQPGPGLEASLANGGRPSDRTPPVGFAGSKTRRPAGSPKP